MPGKGEYIVSVQIKDYSASVKRKMDAALLQALKNHGENWQKIVDRIIVEKDIIDTERLRKSMKHEINQQKKEMKAGTFGDNYVPYAIYNELGTHKMRARPFLSPSIKEANGGFAEVIKQSVGNEMSSTQGLTAEIKNL
jgi:HK97 gp10 family phage protein